MKLLRPFLHQRGVHLVVYLDDFLLMSDNQKLLHQHVELTSSLLTQLGFLLNGILNPSTQLEFLGFTVDSMTLSSQQGQQDQERMPAHVEQESNVCKVCYWPTLLSVTGRCFCPTTLLWSTKTKVKHLETVKLPKSRLRQTVLLNKGSRDYLSWWTCFSFVEGRPLRWPQAVLSIETDASKTGWGAHLSERQQTIGGVWSQEEAKNHINWLELKAAFVGIQAFTQDRSNIHLHLLIDNTVAITYLNPMGGTRSYSLCHLALSIWNWCLERKLYSMQITSQVRADFASRHWHNNSDWMLNSMVLTRLE